MKKLIIRHDDFDFRLDPEEYIALHRRFIEYDLVETAVIQFAQFGRMASPSPELINYMNYAKNWDLQLHGWEHAKYDEMDYSSIYRDTAAALYRFQEMFNTKPSVWYPPWNCYSEEMQQVADELGLKIDNESYDIAQFIREMQAGTFEGHSLYFHLWEKNKEYLIDSMLYWARIYEDRRLDKNN